MSKSFLLLGSFAAFLYLYSQSKQPFPMLYHKYEDIN